MKKEELRYDPIHEKIADIIEHIDNNKYLAIQVLAVIALTVGGWGYFSGLQKNKINTSKSIVGVAQNAYNGGEVDISLSDLKNIIIEYPSTDAGNQALVYLLKDAYQANNDADVLSLSSEHGTSISDRVLDAGLHGILGNASIISLLIKTHYPFFN